MRLLKLKPMPDEEARVLAHLPGKGKHAGRMGALLLALPDGQQFALGTGFSDAQRADPPPVGAIVTYRYRDRTPKGLPRFASFLAGAATIRRMSKAFTKETDNDDDDDEIRLPPLPAGGKNYITPQGFATLRHELKNAD